MCYYVTLFFFVSVVAVADTQRLFCAFKILIHSGRPDKKPAEGSSHPEVSSTFIGIIWTSNGHPVRRYALEERRKCKRNFFSDMMHCGKLHLMLL